MRIGKKITKNHGWTRAGSQEKVPKFISSHVLIGKLSSDIIGTVYQPMIQEKAQKILEEYAQAIVDYEDTLEQPGLAQATIEADGSSSMTTSDKAQPPAPPLFHSQFMIDEADHILKETSDYFTSTTSTSNKSTWKTQADAARFERRLDEKYGVFRPFITHHPEVEQALRGLQRKYAMGYFSPFRQSDSPIPTTTAIIILFMMHRGGMRWEVTLLAFLFFIVGLQPWALVALAVLGHAMVTRRQNKPIGTMSANIPLTKPYYGDDNATNEEKYKKLLEPVGTELKDDNIPDNLSELFDVMILGSGPSALFAASLLSRAGRKVLVLSKEKDASEVLTLDHCADKKYKDIPFDIGASNVAKISKQQELLACALASESDCQGGVRFAQVGSEADGYAFEVLSIPGVGTDSVKSQTPFVLTGHDGKQSLMDIAATCLGDGWPGEGDDIGHSSTGAYADACEGVNASASLFYLSKILPEHVNNLRAASAYHETAIRFASSFLNTSFPSQPHARALMAGIGMKNENLKPSRTSLGAHITNISASLCGEGMHYPVGGPRALCHALATVVEQCGGKVFTNVDVESLLFDESKLPEQKLTTKDDGIVCPPCVGVKLKRGNELRLNQGRSKPAIISMEGIITTFIDLTPEEIRTKYKVPRGLPALWERRPLFKFLFLFEGTAEELSVTGADYYRLPAASLPFDELDPMTGAVKFGDIGGPDDDDLALDEIPEETINEGPEASHVTTEGRKIKTKRVKFEAGHSWLHISFPSTKDPSFNERHGNLTTCVVTIEADDDFTMFWDTKPKLFRPYHSASTQGDMERLFDRVRKDLFEIYPQLEENVLASEIRGPFRGGLSHIPERYAAKGVRVDTPYPGLFLGGSDLTVGDSFSAATVGGWLAANAVMGYSYLDLLFFQKNITRDIENFLEPVSSAEDKDLAVPFTQSFVNDTILDVKSQ